MGTNDERTAPVDAREVHKYDRRAAERIDALDVDDAVRFGRVTRVMAEFLDVPVPRAAAHLARALLDREHDPRPFNTTAPIRALLADPEGPPLDAARAVLTEVGPPDDTVGAMHALTFVRAAAATSIAEDVRRVTAVMESAGSRVLPEIAMLLQQLNAPHEDVPQTDLDALLSLYPESRPTAGRLLLDFRANRWRLIRERTEPVF